MNFKNHIETAWNLTLRNIVALLLLTLVFWGASILTLGILMPVTLAGYTQSLILLLREGREPKMQDLFSEMKLFLPLLVFGIACFVVSTIGFMLFFLPGVVVVFGVTFFCIYMVPLMTDQKLGLIDAIKESYAMTRRVPLVDHLVMVIIYMAISTIGGSIVIGILFTQPLAILFLASVYEENKTQVSPVETSAKIDSES
ncbi:hypothetical protein LJC71_07665 [Desulfosarcina sp. OttesenSCG-928-A07]|nr:hypothetical protein [Desulfosarcina sp. OttesenSCG-928-G17]MDL2329603.1 hypothetical protein [Desulfosarcina sp. OttesenSCG-928-A07]